MAIVNAITEAVNGPDGKWYPDADQINEGYYLAYYFFLLAFLMFVNFILYIFVARSFRVKKEMANWAVVPNEVTNGSKVTSEETTRDTEPDNKFWSFSTMVSHL